MADSQRLLDIPRRSLDSGISESILSLSAFPDTPPTTFSPPSVFHRPLPSLPGSPRSSTRQSPHDWHDGASSMTRGTSTNSALIDHIPGLTTSFITNTLNASPTAMTYPPSPVRPPAPSQSLRTAESDPSRSRTRSTLADGQSVSDEASTYEYYPRVHSDIRATSLTRSLLEGVQVVGVASARLHAISSQTSLPSLDSPPSSSPPGAPPSHPLPSLPVQEHRPRSPSAPSLHSSPPSFVSAYINSLRNAIQYFSHSNHSHSVAQPARFEASTSRHPLEAHALASRDSLPILSKHESDLGVSSPAADPLAWDQPAPKSGSHLPSNSLGYPPQSNGVGFLRRLFSTKKRRVMILLITFCLVALAGIIAGVVVSVQSKNDSTCPEGLAGGDCSLDATCICTSSSDRCDGLAKSLVDLIPSVNDLFQTNFTSTQVYASVWLALGTSHDCVSQANTIDLHPALTASSSPGRLAFAQTAILWNMIQSQDTAATETLRSFVLSAPWSNLPEPDGIDKDGSFKVTASGFSFNFASQTVTPPSVSFASLGLPSTDQLSKVSSGARDALDRMYSVALASASQRKAALENYWSTTLEQNPADLASFVSRFLDSPVLLPFNAELESIQSRFSGEVLTSLPPPLACYENLSASHLNQLNHFEQSVFGMQNVSSFDGADQSCFSTRPTYGVLDVAQLRLPFVDQRESAPKQAVALRRDVASRIILYPWEALSSLPTVDGADLDRTQLNYRQYGTYSSADHIILQYLQSIPDIGVATNLVHFLLGNPTTPPGDDFPVEQLPVVEVAVFGLLDVDDYSSIVSAFANAPDSIFFGSSAAASLRTWAHSTAHLPILWTESDTSMRMVRDADPASDAFVDTWAAAATALDNGIPLEVGNITDALFSTGQFSDAYGFS